MEILTEEESKNLDYFLKNKKELFKKSNEKFRKLSSDYKFEIYKDLNFNFSDETIDLIKDSFHQNILKTLKEMSSLEKDSKEYKEKSEYYFKLIEFKRKLYGKTRTHKKMLLKRIQKRMTRRKILKNFLERILRFL